jgi:xanthine dehydrogenase accessory factor
MISQGAFYRAVIDELEAGRRLVVLTELGGDFRESGGAVKTLINCDWLERNAGSGNINYMLATAALQKGCLQYHDDGSGMLKIAEPCCPESRLIVLGGGHIAKPLVGFGSKCGFSVTVVDDRPSFANGRRFPDAEKVLCESFDRCFPLLNINDSAFVVIVTRGHRHDLDCLRQVLNFKTAYTGMIGSRRRVRAAMELLLAEGYEKEKLDAVRAPIGLDIGALTPEEIAVSILAEVIAYKRRYTGVKWPETDKAVLAELALDCDEDRALATIIETKGSVPRDIGAKMVVYPDGRIVGSIGGGCSESGVIQSAYDVIRSVNTESSMSI